MRKNRKKDKGPKLAKSPTAGKIPKAEAPQGDESRYPSWRIARMECVDDFGAWHKLDPATLHGIREKLASFETMTWGEILGSNNHAIPVSRLIKEAGQRLIDLKLDDQDELVSLRLTGTKRIFGFRDGATLVLLWWDPLHRICPSNPKHT